MGRLLGFTNEDETDREPLPMTFPDYLELVEWSGRAVVAGKRGAIPEDLAPILERLGINPEGYVRYVRREADGFERKTWGKTWGQVLFHA